MCVGKKCLAPEPCKALQVDHSEYLRILRKLRKLPKVKRVFIRSGIRFDYVMADKDDTFFKELVAEHVSGQLKVDSGTCEQRGAGQNGQAPYRMLRGVPEAVL